MITSSLTHVRDLLHAQLCYQAFITPIFLPLEKPYRDFAKRACEFIEGKRTEVIHQEFPRHYVLHRFEPQRETNNRKVLIAHGWISRAAYMARLIDSLYQQGYEVYALDFPAHGEAKGLQLPWTDAVAILRDTINQYGPFYAVIGHSFGGSMLLNTLNVSGQLPDWQLKYKPECAILIASPTQMRSPVNRIAKKFKLSGHGYLQLRQVMRQQAQFDLKLIRLNHFISQKPHIPFLCIHGELDKTISIKESIEFCEKYPDAKLCLLPEANHISVLVDKRVEQLVCDFLERPLCH
ncbi:putative hydrolase [Legionella sainthelensi]|uniref:Putative hydrolase n=1 Tax=Legionella sainthelensi TaxID=28087 RepID=A0A0W0YPM6_9GAMM|nr:alpha/beta fold hydrolase [Legionella sainthelensi]KTD58502.1 putative hydrolase [Legionella sainthelensi]VEH27599.1 putative hydrolase [Legionella sainthelensi]